MTAFNPVSTWTFGWRVIGGGSATELPSEPTTKVCGFSGAFWHARKLARNASIGEENVGYDVVVTMNNSILSVIIVFETFSTRVVADNIKLSINSPFFHLVVENSEYSLGSSNHYVSITRDELRALWKRVTNNALDGGPSNAKNPNGRAVDSIHLNYEGLLNMQAAPFQMYPTSPSVPRPYAFFPSYVRIDDLDCSIDGGTTVEYKNAVALFRGALRHPKLLNGIVTDYNELKINLTPEVIEWLASNEIQWRISNNEYILIREEDYTLYKVMFE